MNRLASEKSPYLLQHADNPVDWYPWGEEAFAAARRDDRPIFLSVGYATCHWCHVMAHESFEDARAAAVLNANYVAIKVDREERPDVDRIYMTFVQATTGGGGWPMSVWLTPDLRPFYGGTYFPPEAQWGRPGFADVLVELARLWREERPRVLQVAAGIGDHLSAVGMIHGGTSVPGTDALANATRDFLGSYDARHGGFGGAPKFPRPSELLFLLREHARTGDRAPLEAVAHTLRAMAAGGMRDHVGGGFHRYSVDAQWRVPHFEKMLYDQAQLALAYLDAAQATGDPFFADVAEDTLRYVQRDLTDLAGGFHSAEDADSLPPGEPEGGHRSEGAFYLWTAGEIDEQLGADAAVFRERFGIRPGGNALQDPQGEFRGRNILFQARSVDDIAKERQVPIEEVRDSIARSRQRLLEARSGRPRPQLDDKVLTAWNGLTIAAFARAARVVPAMSEAPEAQAAREAAASYLISARRAATFIRERMSNEPGGQLLRRFRGGDAAIGAYAEDYACLVFGLLELFQADGDPAWLEWAARLQARQDELFWDKEAGGWFSTTGRDASILLRLKDAYDGAEPAASSLSVGNLLTLSRLMPGAGEPVSGGVTRTAAAAGAGQGQQWPARAAERIQRTLRLFGPRIETAARSVPMMLAALSAWHAGPSEIVLVGPSDSAGVGTLLREVDRAYLPFAVLVRLEPEGDVRHRLVASMPWLEPMGMRNGRPTAYVCRDFACQAPTTKAAVLREQLRDQP